MKKSECLEPKIVRTDGGRVVRENAKAISTWAPSKAKFEVGHRLVGGGTVSHISPSRGVTVDWDSGGSEHYSAKSARAELQVNHKETGEKHLRSAAHPGASPEAKAGHLERAAQHAAAAGSDWDEAKHPRDENGKFA